MDKIQDIVIEATDFYGDICLGDSVGFNNKSKERRPLGEVHIYEQTKDGKKKILHKNNLVLYHGREMLAQRLVNINNTFFTSGHPSKDEFVSWFGLGDGGVRPSDPLDPVPPINNDDYLYSPIPVFDSTGTEFADFHTAGDAYPGGGVYTATGSYVKQFDLTGDSTSRVVFQGDVLNDNRQLVLQITTTIGATNANGYQLSEAGLFSAESSNHSYNGNFTLFARVTFPSLIKTSDRRLIFVWYLYV